jgi:membrane associated rhomboid family serine protease
MSVEIEPWVAVATLAEERGSAELALVLTARGIEHRRSAVPGGWEVSVPARLAERATAELAAYRAENARRTGRRQLMEVGSGWPGVAAYVATLLVVFLAVHSGALDRDWLAAGSLEMGRVRAGEWWRVVTALTVHVEPDHLLGNLAFGSFFGYFAGRYFGTGVGWLAIVGAAAVADALDAAIQPPGNSSIGASTAVFAALGLLTAYTWQRGFWKSTPWRARIAPIVAGIGLLAFTGAGGENTDVTAHLAGFVTGFGGGWLLARLAGLAILRSPAMQRGCAAATALIVAAAWAWGLIVAG